LSHFFLRQGDAWLYALRRLFAAVRKCFFRIMEIDSFEDRRNE
jgi:hypothetical protein